MDISRRTLLRRIGAGAAVGVGLPPLALAATAGSRDSSLGDARHPGGLLRLHLNENALGPSPKAIAAIQTAAGSATNRYPDATGETLRHNLAALHGVSADQVVLGCGSGEILRMAASAFSGSHRKVIVARPTFELMADCAGRAGADVVSIPLRADHSHDLDAMLARADGSTGLVYLCNPNNPTGSLTRRNELEVFLRMLPPTTRVLVDEAYHHYVAASSDYASFIDRPMDDRRVIVTRSFSTIHGLAGARIGYAIASATDARMLGAARLPDNVNVVAAAAAIAALEDAEHVRACARRNADDRQEFCNQANARMLRTIDSHANFVMLNTGHPAAAMIEHFAKNGVLVAGPFPSFDKYVRVSLGTPADMREFWRVWDLLPPMHAMTM